MLFYVEDVMRFCACVLGPITFVRVGLCAPPGLERATGPVWTGGDDRAACCNDVPNFGHMLDFSEGVLDFNGRNTSLGDTLIRQLVNHCVYFGSGTFSPASGVATEVEIVADEARPTVCRYVASGLPHFPGLEVMQFSEGYNFRSGVSKVGASVGYCDHVGTCFLEAYDQHGNLLGTAWNSVVGFEFLSIERSPDDKDIHYVVFGDSNDPAGCAVNCITFDDCEPLQGTPTSHTRWGKVKSIYR